MLKIVYLFLLISLSATLAHSQDTIPKSRFGFKAGVNLSEVRSKTPDETGFSDIAVGPVFGVFWELYLADKIKFQPEILFNSVGGKTDTGTIKFNYLSIPFLFKSHGKHFGVVVGPQIGLMLSGKLKHDMNPSEDLKDRYKSTDLSFILGAEYDFGLNNRFVGGVRLQYPIANVYKDVPGSAIKNYAVSGFLGFRFK